MKYSAIRDRLHVLHLSGWGVMLAEHRQKDKRGAKVDVILVILTSDLCHQGI